jgi:hypothetical protein
MVFYRSKLHGFVWSKVDGLGGTALNTGDVRSYDVGDFFSDRQLIVGITVKDSVKYSSRNPLKAEATLNLVNRFDARLTKTQPLFEGYGSSRIFIELL